MALQVAIPHINARERKNTYLFGINLSDEGLFGALGLFGLALLLPRLFRGLVPVTTVLPGPGDENLRDDDEDDATPRGEVASNPFFRDGDDERLWWGYMRAWW